MTQPDDLNSKIAGIRPKTMAARLLPYWPAIEQKISEGIEHQDIVDILIEEGLTELKLTTFRRYLDRYRKKSGTQKRPSTVQSTAPPVGGNQPAPAVIESMGTNPPTTAPAFESAIDSKKRSANTEKYLAAQKPLLPSKNR